MDGAPGEAHPWLEELERELSERSFTASDKRRILHITVNSSGDPTAVSLADNWLRTLQAQALSREVWTTYASAREKATEWTTDLCAKNGLESLRVGLLELAERSTAYAESRRQLELESFTGESANARVLAQFDAHGSLTMFRVAPRYASEAQVNELEQAILEALRRGRAEILSRASSLASELTDARSMEDRLEEQLTTYGQRIDELIAHFPGGRGT